MKTLQQNMWNGLGRGMALLTVAATTVALADTIELRDGKLIQGMFVGGTQTTVRLQTKTETKVIPIADILAVTFDRPAAAAPAATTPAVLAVPAAAAVTAPAAKPAAATQAATTPVVPAPAALPPKPSLAAGSKIQVRINETVDSTANQVGSKFTGVLTAELRAGEVVLAPLGAAVAGELTAGTAPRPALQLALTGISINGQLKPVATDDVIAVSAPLTKKNMKSAAIGAVFGALGGGGSEGAAQGVGTGALASVVTKGDSVSVPATSVLAFQLKTAFTP